MAPDHAHAPPRLLLFDVDATLLTSGGAGRRGMERAYRELYGIEGAFRGIVPDGNTDPSIFREIFRLRGIEEADEEAAVARVAQRYLRHLADEVPTSPGARLMPGLPELLERLQEADEVHLGLLTGNLEAGARTKLSRFDLNRFFPFGAFASDHVERARLVPIAVARAEATIDRPIGMGRHVVVIGDSPLDVACALANGATAVGVGTGRSSPAELVAAGAHLAFENLADVDRVVEALVGVSKAG